MSSSLKGNGLKNKPITYVLVVGVIVLWSVVFYKIYLTMGQTNEVQIQPVFKKPKKNPPLNNLNDTITLTYDYRNPFTGYYEEVKSVEKVNPVKKIIWPAIVYTGYIINAQSKSKLFIVLLNGKELMLPLKQHIDGIQIVGNKGDVIQIAYQKETKYFKLR